jgi:hypothetical protein
MVAPACQADIKAVVPRRLEGRWRIDSFRFNLKFLDGNLELEEAE